ncbi:MAG: hypothetical protein R3Y46_00975 [Opitutales bacterium]
MLIFTIHLRHDKSLARDLEKAIELSYSLNKDLYRRQIIADWKTLYRAGKSSEKFEKIVCELLAKDIEEGLMSDINIYYNLSRLGYGKEGYDEKVFKALYDFNLKYPKNTTSAERLAYVYENGIGTVKTKLRQSR